MRTERRQLSVLDLDGLAAICGAGDAARRGAADQDQAPGEPAVAGEPGRGGEEQGISRGQEWSPCRHAGNGRGADRPVVRLDLQVVADLLDIRHGRGRVRDPARNDVDRHAVRRGFYGILRSVFDESGVPWADCYHEDRGDGVVIVVPPTIAVARVVDPLVAKLADHLRQYNRHASEVVRIQMRAALHVGPVGRDGEGLSGQAVILAARILDAQVIKDKLRNAGADLVFAASTYVYDHVIRHVAQVDAASYERVECQVKESAITAWIDLAGSNSSGRAAPGDPAALAAASARPPWLRPPFSDTGAVASAADTLPVAAPFGRLPAEVRGRDGLLAELRRPLSRMPRQAGRTWVLAGMGGLGKSTVALAVARVARARGWRVWWVTAADAASLTGGMLEVLRELGAPDAVTAGAGGCADRAGARVGVPERRACGGPEVAAGFRRRR